MFQKTVDYPDEWSNGFHVMLDSEVLVTVRWDQVAVSLGSEQVATGRWLGVVTE